MQPPRRIAALRPFHQQLPLAPLPATLQKLCVQLYPTRHTRHRHHDVAPRMPHEAFDVSFGKKRVLQTVTKVDYKFSLSRIRSIH
jgi:hypothetical protein